jgi:hypothetical protein
VLGDHLPHHAKCAEELSIVQEAAGAVAALEEHYWHAFNDLSLQLGTHLQERDATLAKVGDKLAMARLRRCDAAGQCVCRQVISCESGCLTVNITRLRASCMPCCCIATASGTGAQLMKQT